MSSIRSIAIFWLNTSIKLTMCQFTTDPICLHSLRRLFYQSVFDICWQFIAVSYFRINSDQNNHDIVNAGILDSRVLSIESSKTSFLHKKAYRLKSMCDFDSSSLSRFRSHNRRRVKSGKAEYSNGPPPKPKRLLISTKKSMFSGHYF